jgi:hypothetical protein
MENEYLKCHKCKRKINYGNGYFTILKNIEQRELITEDYGEIQILASREIITLCGGCGNAFDWNGLQIFVEELPLLNPKDLPGSKATI